MSFNFKLASQDQYILNEYRNIILQNKGSTELGRYVAKYEEVSFSWVFSKIVYLVGGLFSSTFKDKMDADRGKLFVVTYTKEVTNNALAASLKTEAVLKENLLQAKAIENLGPIGLPNIGNSCYLNSVVQLIMAMDDEDLCIFVTTIGDKALREAFIDLVTYTRNPAATTNGLGPFMSNLRESIFNLGLNYFPKNEILEQQDAQELLTVVLQGLFINFQNVKKPITADSEKFISKVKNEKGSMISVPVRKEAEQGWLDYLFSSSKSPLQIDYCLDDYFNEDVHDPQNALTFNLNGNDTKVSNYSIQNRISSEPPKYLFVHLVRQSFENGLAHKNHAKVDLTAQIDLSKYVTPDVQQKFAGKLSYEPVGVVQHYGDDPRGGHYAADIMKKGKWFNCNDSFVNPTDFNSIDKQNSYIMMLKRV